MYKVVLIIYIHRMEFDIPSTFEKHKICRKWLKWLNFNNLDY